jgi:hypothetical protein
LIPNIISVIAPIINSPGAQAASQAKVPISPKTAIPIVSELVQPAIQDPIIDLLKDLLPVDSPVGTMLERFRLAIMNSMAEPMSQDAIGNILTLLKALPIDLKTVTGEQLRTVIDRLGLRYEPMLNEAFSQGVPVPVRQLTEQNLKAALLTLLEASLPDVSVSTLALPSHPEASVASPAANSISSGQSQAAATATATSILGDSFTHQPTDILETTLLKQLEAQSKGALIAQPELMAGEGKVVQQGAEAQQSGKVPPQVGDLRRQAEQLLGTGGLQQLLQSVNPQGSQDMELALLKLFRPSPEGLQTRTGEDHPASPLQPAPIGDDLQELMIGLKNLGTAQQDPLAVEQFRKLVMIKLAAADPGPAANDSVPATLSASMAGSQGTSVRQQGHELLAAIERTQVLNSVNNERGEPLTFQIPIMLDGRPSTAAFYVERRLDEGQQTASPEERHYRVVALLDLSELGALRVDLAMHKKQLSVKVTVERVETEALASRLLPELGETLGEKGFAVEFLKCERKTDGSAKGEELRERTLPENSLINLQA